MTWTEDELGFRSGEYIVGPRPNDQSLSLAYISMERGGVLEKVFHQCEPSLRWFLDWLNEPGVEVPGIWRCPAPDLAQLVGLGFVNQRQNLPGLVKAEIGFTFLPDFPLNFFTKVQLIQGVLDYTLTRTGITSLFGTIPEPNKGSYYLASRVGMRTVGIAPEFASWKGRSCDVWIMQMDRQTWINQRPHLSAAKD